MAKKTRRKEPKKDRAAVALGRKRWAKRTAEEKSEHARRMNEIRGRKTPRKEDWFMPTCTRQKKRGALVPAVLNEPSALSNQRSAKERLAEG